MTDCAKTLDFFAAWKRMCQEQHGACRGCPLFGDATGSIFTCQRYAFEQPAEAVRIVQAWADAHPAQTWKVAIEMDEMLKQMKEENGWN